MKDNFFEFAKAVGTSMKGAERGIVVSFECPVCQSTAQAVKSEYNGHVHAECKGCGFELME